MRRVRVAVLAAVPLLIAGAVAGIEVVPAAAAPTTSSSAVLPLGQSGTWITDAAGRIVVLHGLNQVFKVPPYLPSADGFGSDDAAFLAANGFTAVRVGLIWGAVEPQPGFYDDSYLNGIAATVQVLAEHGIVSLLDFHQDLYNEKFQGEGAPAWATQDGGLPNPKLGFPLNYFANPAENHAWDAFWQNAKAPDGIGLQVHYANAWAHVAARFRTAPSVLGYEVMNEPWPGAQYTTCLAPVIGCPLFDSTLTKFYQRVVPAIRATDPLRTIWLEPAVLFNEGVNTSIGTTGDPHTGFAFHDYCAFAAELNTNLGCAQEDSITFANAVAHARRKNVPPLVTEYGASNDLANLAEVMAQADRNRMGWLEWAYTGNDITSSSPNGQALVLDPSQPPTGANVVTDKLRTLAEPYPQVVAGTPTSWGVANGVFALAYSTQRAGSLQRYQAGSVTAIAAPAIRYPHGYTVTVTGAHVISTPGATTVLVASNPGATTITVTIR